MTSLFLSNRRLDKAISLTLASPPHVARHLSEGMFMFGSAWSMELYREE